MATTGSMFLTLTPPIHEKESSHIPGPIDHVTLNLAVESLSYHFVSGDTFGPVASAIKAAAVDNATSISQSNGTFTSQEKSNSPSVSVSSVDSESDMFTENDKSNPSTNSSSPTESETSDPQVKSQLDNPIIPAIQPVDQEKMAATLPAKFQLPATTLKRRLEDTKDLIVCPGVYDGFSARIALSVGFDAMYMVSTVSFAPHQP